VSTVPRGNFRHVKVGDTVTRMLAGQIPMKLGVTKVDDDLIYCGFADPEQAWTFDRDTGAEVDDDLRWGPQYRRTGSYLVDKEKE
jgi:hypothetical protein